MKAKSIEDALNLFDPHRPLIEEDDLKAYYVARDHSPLDEMKTILKTAMDFPKLLFSGPPGCGKTTELAQLRESLKKDFHIFMFSVKEIASTFEVNLDSMFFCILKKLADKAKEEKLSIYNDKLQKFIERDFGWEANIEQTITAKNVKGITVPLEQTILAGAKEDLQLEGSVKYVYKKLSKPNPGDIIDLINATVWDLEEKTKKDVLVLVADMDKISVDNAVELFIKSALLLTKVQCFTVYTFPFELKHRNDFVNIYRSFNGVYYLPNFILNNRAGEPDENVQKKLKEIITKRIQTRLIYDEAIDLAVQLTGGIVHELINLLRQSCIVALMQKLDFIDDEVVHEAEERIRRFYRSVYTEEERKLLLQIRQNKKFIDTDVSKRLFRQYSFTEYGISDDTWYNVNPILFPLLEEIKGTEE